MQNSYDVYLGQDVTGRAYVKQEGLFYHFQCKCQLPSTSIHYVILQCGNKEFNLGVCVPDGDTFRADKRIPLKQFDNTEFKFHLTQKNDENKVRITVDSQKPFEHLQLLENAHLDHSDGFPQICLQGTTYLNPIQQGNDLSQES